MVRLSLNFSLLMGILTAISSAIAIFTAVAESNGVSLLLAVSFLLIAVYAVLYSFKNNASLEVILLVVLCVFHVLVNGLVENGELGFNYFKKLIMFLCFVILLNYGKRYGDTLSDRTVSLIKGLPVIVSLVLAASYFFFDNTERIADGVTLGFSNPNLTGMWLLHLTLFVFLYIFEFRETSMYRLLLIPVLAALVYLTFETKARSCMIGLFIFGLLMILLLFRIRLGKWSYLAIAILPAVFVLFYLGVVEADWFQSAFSFMVSKGKGLGSRVTLWTDALEAFWKHPLTGDYAGISNGTGMSQMHNTHLDVLCSYGLIPGILFIRNLYFAIRKAGSSAQSNYQYAAFCAFCSVIVMGVFEAAVVSGSLGVSYLTVVLLILSERNIKVNDA